MGDWSLEINIDLVQFYQIRDTSNNKHLNMMERCSDLA